MNLTKSIEEILENIEKFAGKLYGLEVVISDEKDDKKFIAGFEAGKKFMKEEIIKIIK